MYAIEPQLYQTQFNFISQGLQAPVVPPVDERLPPYRASDPSKKAPQLHQLRLCHPLTKGKQWEQLVDEVPLRNVVKQVVL